MKLAKKKIFSVGEDYCRDILKQVPEAKLLMDWNGNIESIEPCESLFGYTYHGVMIPPFKPESTLILGYGMGTVANLMRKIYGPVKITAVDIRPPDVRYIEDRTIVTDAYRFVKECAEPLIKRRFDYVVVDLFEDGEVLNFVFNPDFVVLLRLISKCLISVNIRMEDFNRMKAYHDYGFQFHKHTQIFGNIVSFWGIGENSK